ncbi:MAG: UDP-N-acetylmuramate dehydrogenase [Proteobacteria bacterium]|jgi:UDP-N-acetylmuramate dehydrogenase|nr:UDP-N-acetylmuramate dehydrogenase [Desulfocapsa sp.]MBU3944775.1 UDP-N-acetylmuramate dehydrogenase [Pseudomonadota bacterium]MCG2744245.1 UDP-N-acetylmuramate dehydrogenase [Desulfobacteraceae bacterium]MDO8946578.1 UDP-N-acetylmuramate dehydrogenase [Desulfocapsaceae bacterium]MBU3982030.1 UDP-N-acetylmuramate dehydrogenase [Pseudomonadota bacterium]
MAMGSELRKELASLVSSPVLWDCPLSGYTSFAIGGPAAALITVEELAELQRLLVFFKKQKIQWRVIGRGTNLLVSDTGFDGVVLILGKGFTSIARRDGVENGGGVIQVGAACSLTRLVDWCVDQSLSGVEFTAGIPGTIGGAVIMNAGAWGRELAEVLVSVTCINSSGQVCTLPRAELEFGYRTWHDHYRTEKDRVVVGVELQCVVADQDQIRNLCQSYRAKRRMKQPKGEPNAGSFFKNPEGDAAGRLIEASGLKGLRVGGAMVSPVHANFLVNSGGATAADVLELMEKVRLKVQEDSGIVLEPEVHFL